MSQNKATRRQKLRSAASHRRLADEMLDSIADSQAKWNATMAKLDADTDGAIASDYESTGAITDVFEADDEGQDAQHKATLRQAMRSAFAHKRLADEIADAMEEQQTAYNTFLVKLDGDTTTADGDYSTLAVEVLDADGEGHESQHKRSLRETLRSALTSRSLADDIMDALTSLQENMNASLADIDANPGVVNGRHAAFTVTETDPDA